MRHKLFALVSLLVVFSMIVPAGKLTALAQLSADAPALLSELNVEGENTSGIIINEVMFYPDAGNFEWVELKNNGPAPLTINGWGLTDEDGNWYQFPAALHEVPAGAFVVVIYDGAGSSSNDYDFLDNVATLHTQVGLVNILEDDADQVGLYNGFLYRTSLPLILNISSPKQNAQTIIPHPYTVPQVEILPNQIISFVAWGGTPGIDAANATEAELWLGDWYVVLSRSMGMETNLQTDGESIGILPGSTTNYPDSWELFAASEATPGEENLTPVISWVTLQDGESIAGSTFGIAWNLISGAAGYNFQLDDSFDFSTPLINTTVTEPRYISPEIVPDGIYYWRVKVSLNSGITSAWSVPNTVEVFTLSELSSHSITSSITPDETLSSKLLPITSQLQHKDTRMLDLQGSTEFGKSRWDSSHEVDGDWIVDNDDPSITNELDSMYCVRATISMMASYYGGDLSQDRISYEFYHDTSPGPETDLGHGYGPEKYEILSWIKWALGTEDIIYISEKPSFEQIKLWIDEGRVILSGVSSKQHLRIIAGYNDSFGINKISIIDPSIGVLQVKNYYNDPTDIVWVGPAGNNGAPNVRSDEDEDGDGIADTIDDSDGDGVVDFDEAFRFTGLDKSYSDSDRDFISDKLDIREYVFNDSGIYSWRNPYINASDLDRKEVDADHDNDGSPDGCEDTNRNGKYEPGLGETSNFDPSQAKDCNPSPGDRIFIPAGEFQMGCDFLHNDGYQCTPDELPLHTVYLDSYTIDATEVTNAEYELCDTVGPCTPPLIDYSATRADYYGNPEYADYPIYVVSWYQARTYCTWAGGFLPSEAQWEKAARGSSGTRAYPWGDQSPDCTLANNDYSGTGDFLCVGDTSTIGSYPLGASPYGVLDMAGNVWEWVNDWYSDTYYSTSPEANPTGPSSGTFKVLRGGSFNWFDYHMLVAHRRYYYPVNEYQGSFRCAYAP